MEEDEEEDNAMKIMRSEALWWCLLAEILTRGK